MSIRDMKGAITEFLPVNTVMASVSDKSGLEDLVPALMQMNPGVIFMSTGGTYKRIEEILGAETAEHLIPVEDYTEFPEMPGGLVKTLHPKIHAGILGERNNTEHKAYLANLTKTIEFNDPKLKRVFDAEVGMRYEVTVVDGITCVYIDLLISNLYPFEDTIARPDVTFEKARGNIDIGGPTMARGGAKNFHSCAVLTDPGDYKNLVALMKTNEGKIPWETRMELAEKVFKTTGTYDIQIYTYLRKQRDHLKQVRQNYTFI